MVSAGVEYEELFYFFIDFKGKYGTALAKLFYITDRSDFKLGKSASSDYFETVTAILVINRYNLESAAAL